MNKLYLTFAILILTGCASTGMYDPPCVCADPQPANPGITYG